MISPFSAATITDAAALVEELTRFRIIAAERLQEKLADYPGGSASGLAEFLVVCGELTRFQAELSGFAKTLTWASPTAPMRQKCAQRRHRPAGGPFDFAGPRE